MEGRHRITGRPGHPGMPTGQTPEQAGAGYEPSTGAPHHRSSLVIRLPHVAGSLIVLRPRAGLPIRPIPLCVIRVKVISATETRVPS